MITITLNGEIHQLKESISIDQLLKDLQLQPTLYLVELNQVALFRSEWENQKIKAEDQIEIIRIVAGG
jgi:thiamine biosynthesis protein ThiS